MTNDERAPLTELNRVCLRELQRGSTAASGAEGPPLLVALRSSWIALDAAAIDRLAAAPFAWVDTHFAALLAGGARGQFAPVGVRDAGENGATGFFAADIGRQLVRSLASLGWHLARSSPRTAQLALGCEASAIESLAQAPLAAIDILAERDGATLTPRWPRQIDYWHGLLTAATHPTDGRLEELLLYGVQRIAGDAWAHARVAR
jgi:hypothetical protein